MPFGFLAIVAGVSAVVMLLWNWLMPVLFGLITINFWQALGLFALTRILFGKLGFGRRGMMGHHHRMGENPMHKKWRQMTPEQRKEFVEKRRKFGFGAPFCKGDFDMSEDKERGQDGE